MFDLGLTELLLIGIVALIIVGPKDLPVLFRRVGEFVGRMKGMAREFTSAMNDAADEAGIDWDDNEDFMLASEVLTGERHLDDMCQGQLGAIMDAIDLYKRKEDFSN